MKMDAELSMAGIHCGLHICMKPLEASDVESWAKTRGYEFFHIVGSGVDSEEGFLRAAAEALRFPHYYGANWDAFEECLRDLEWVPAPGYVILVDNLELLRFSAPAELEAVLPIFADVAAYWETQGTFFEVILVWPAGEDHRLQG
ncbi:MAG: barstar family protein [Acidobacteriota bacterium]|jgi:hypothetical protein